MAISQTYEAFQDTVTVMWNIYAILSLSFIFDLTIQIPNIYNKKVPLLLELVSTIFYQFFIFSTNDSHSRTIEGTKQFLKSRTLM